MYRAPQKVGPRLCEYAVENCVPCTDCTQENFTFYFLFIQSQLKYCYLLSMLTPYMCGIKHNDEVQSGEMERNPDMDESAVWAGKGCMAVFPISRLRFIFPPCSLVDSEKKNTSNHQPLKSCLPHPVCCLNVCTARFEGLKDSYCALNFCFMCS